MRGFVNARGGNRRGKPQLASLAGGLVLSVIGSGFAAAQGFDDRDMPMPPRVVVWRLNDRGFTAVSRPLFDGRAYVVEADDPYGERVRVFVDAHDGAILRRQRLAFAAPPPPMRAARPAPGYGWTEEEAVPRRPIREVERIVPPGDRFDPSPRRAPLDVAPSARTDLPDRNPMGLNPDARGRTEASTKATRLNSAPKPVVPKAIPAAPKLSETPPARPTPEPAPATAALEAPKPVTPATNATAATPAAVQPPETKAAKDWKDPPADQKKPVRVIGGATLVPGATEPAKD
jgi:hypothetical protein